MPIQQVSFKNNVITQYNLQKVGSNQVVQSFEGTPQEPQKNKDDKTLKYILIGAGALAAIIAAINHKKIGELFKGKTEIKPDVKPTPKETSKGTSTTSQTSTSTNSNHSNTTSQATSSKSEAKIEKPQPQVDSTPTSKTNQIKDDIFTENLINNASEVKIPPSPLVPLEDIKQSRIPLFDGESKGYQLWHFTSNEFFKKFVDAHEDLSELMKKIKLSPYDSCHLKSLQKNAIKGDKATLNFIKTVKEKTNVNLLDEITHYRFIGQSEMDLISAKKPINPIYNSVSFITLDPYGAPGILRHNFKYRVTFKNTENILKHMESYHDNQYMTSIDVPYTYLDVEKVEKAVNEKLQEVKI